MQKKNLVVIGNGMAGARAVEEILARDGDQQFEITMFGDEPYGNYNRILLSNVLNGSQRESEIYLNPLDWYRDNGITLHIGVQADSILRKSKCVLGCDGTIEAYDKLIIATGSRSYIPPIAGLTLENRQYKPGLFVFRTLDDCREIEQARCEAAGHDRHDAAQAREDRARRTRGKRQRLAPHRPALAQLPAGHVPLNH